MKSIIKSVVLIDTTVRVLTKSNKIVRYYFDTTESARNYYDDMKSYEFENEYYKTIDMS